MSAHKKQAVVAAKTGIVVGDGKHKSSRIKRRLMAIVVCALVIVAVIILGVWSLFYRPSHHTHVQQLQSAITNARDNGDATALKEHSSSLIKSQQQGTAHLSDKDLAQVYITRAEGELNTGNYKAAADDYQKAVRLDPLQKDSTLYGQFLAQYKLGNRDTAIQLLQELADSLKNNHSNGVQSDRATYLQYIQELKDNQELPL